MHYPTLKTIPAAREVVERFSGLNRREDIQPGEFAEMENFTSDHAPLAATARADSFWQSPCPQGILGKEQLCHVSDNLLFVGEDAYDLGLTGGEKQLISMGAYLLILPDKKYFNTADPQDWGKIDKLVEEPMWVLHSCDSMGASRMIRYVSAQMPDGPKDGDFWYDTAGPRLKQYQAQQGIWTAAQSYVRADMIYKSNPKYPYEGYFTDNFATGDRVRFQILGDALVNEEGGSQLDHQMEPEVVEQALWGLAGEKELRVLSGTCVVFPGLLPCDIRLGNRLRFGSRMPELDFVFECGNRLWGCRYGTQNGQFVNEIYASQLGDFRNWSSFQGVSTDAYAASVGTDGPFTGAINYLGYPLFFKEHCLHRVYGSYPGEYRIQTSPCPGVARGAEKSLCLLGDTALYLGRNGVYAYDGAMPSLISRELGDLKGPSCAGVKGHKYYLALFDGLYVYDSRKALWHRSSPVESVFLCHWQGHLFYGDPGKDRMMALEEGEEDVEFSFTTGILAGNRQQVVRSICLRYSLTGWARVTVDYDSRGTWEASYQLPSRPLGWAHLALRPRRCDHFRLKIQGRGRLQLHSIIKTLEKGSDLP